MGKQKKLHRKKVQKRNANLKIEHKKLRQELEEQFKSQILSKTQLPTYATTGDFITKNYDEVFKKGGIAGAATLIESAGDGPKFSGD